MKNILNKIPNTKKLSSYILLILLISSLSIIVSVKDTSQAMVDLDNSLKTSPNYIEIITNPKTDEDSISLYKTKDEKKYTYSQISLYVKENKVALSFAKQNLELIEFCKRLIWGTFGLLFFCGIFEYLVNPYREKQKNV